MDDPEEPASPADATRDALHQFAELRAYAQQFIAAKVDLAKVTARNIAIFAVLGIVAAIGGVAMLVVGVVMLFNGLAGAIGSAMGGRVWAGNLIVGLLILGAFAGGAIVGIRIIRRQWLKATVKKYEHGQKQQRESFGQSSRDRTASQGRVEV